MPGRRASTAARSAGDAAPGHERGGGFAGHLRPSLDRATSTGSRSSPPGMSLDASSASRSASSRCSLPSAARAWVKATSTRVEITRAGIPCSAPPGRAVRKPLPRRGQASRNWLRLDPAAAHVAARPRQARASGRQDRQIQPHRRPADPPPGPRPHHRDRPYTRLPGLGGRYADLYRLHHPPQVLVVAAHPLPC